MVVQVGRLVFLCLFLFKLFLEILIPTQMHNNAYTTQSVAKSSKWMIGVTPKGTTGQTMMNRQVTRPIQKMSSNTHKIPETTGKQPSKEGELKCYEYGQKGHM